MQIEPELFDFIQQCENAPMFPKVGTTTSKQTNCDTDNHNDKENQTINTEAEVECDLSNRNDSRTKTSCVGNILKIIN